MEQSLRRLLYCVLLVVSCAPIVACAAAPAPTPTATPAATAVPTRVPRPTPRPPTATPLPPSPTPEPAALRLWAAEQGPQLEALRALLEPFTATTGVRVELLPRPPDGLRLSIATAALVGDPPPDLIWGDENDLAGLLAASELQAVGPADTFADALPALLVAARADDQLWGVPLAARSPLLLMYNRALVPAPPATSDELIVRSRAATTPEVAGLVMAWYEARWLAPWLYAFDGTLTTADGARPALNTPAMEGALNLLRELYRAAPDDGDGYRRGQRLFGQGYAALAVDGDWAIAGYQAMSDTLDLGIAPLPVVPATGRPAAPLLGGTFLMLHRSLDEAGRERADELIAYLAEPEHQVELAVALGRLPALREALADPAIGADPARAAAAALAPAAPGLPPTAAARCALFGVDVWLRSAISGSRSSAEAASAMQREAEACMSR